MKNKNVFFTVLFAVALASLICDGCGKKEATYDELMKCNSLVESARRAKDPSVKKRIQELRKKIDSVKDQNILARIAIEDQIRYSIEVLNKISDQALLAKIATETVSSIISDECLRKIDDPIQLMFVATNQAGRLDGRRVFNPWTKLTGNSWGENRRVPYEQLAFVIEWADPDGYFDVDVDAAYWFALNRLENDEVFQKAADSRIARLSEESAMPDNPAERRKHDKLITLLCSRILKMQNHDNAAILLGKLASASKGRLGIVSDFRKGYSVSREGLMSVLSTLRQWNVCSKFFSECQNPVELFPSGVLQSEDYRDIAMSHDNPKARLMAAGSKALSGNHLLEVALKATDQNVREMAKKACCGSDAYKLCEYVSRWDPSYLESPIETILTRGKEMEPDVPYAEFVADYDPEFKFKDFNDVVKHGKQLKPIKSAIESIDFKLKMHSPDSILSGAKSSEAEIVSAFHHIDFSNNQNAYDLGMKLGKFIRHLTELQKICDSEAEEIRSLLKGLPTIDKNTKLGEMVEITRRKGTEAIASFAKTKEELKKLEEDSRGVASTFDRFN